MPLYWLCYQHNNQISVVIEPGASLIHARMRPTLANLGRDVPQAVISEERSAHFLDGRNSPRTIDDGWTGLVGPVHA